MDEDNICLLTDGQILLGRILTLGGHCLDTTGDTIPARVI